MEGKRESISSFFLRPNHNRSVVSPMPLCLLNPLLSALPPPVPSPADNNIHFSASVSRKKKSKAQAQQYSQVQAHLAQPQQTFSPSVAADSQGALTVPVSSEACASRGGLAPFMFCSGRGTV